MIVFTEQDSKGHRTKSMNYLDNFFRQLFETRTLNQFHQD